MVMVVRPARLVLRAAREQEQPLAFRAYVDGDLLNDLLNIDDLRHKLLLFAGDGKDRIGELLIFVPRLS